MIATNAQNIAHSQGRLRIRGGNFARYDSRRMITERSNPIYLRILKRLKVVGLSSEAASRMAGKSRGFIRVLGQNPDGGISAKAAVALASVLRCRVEWLMTGEEPEEGGEPEEPHLATPQPAHPARDRLDAVLVAEHDVRAGASFGGGLDAGEINGFAEGQVSYEAPAPRDHWSIPGAFIRGELRVAAEDIDIISVQGPSMDDGSRYALIDGDRVIISRRERNPAQGGIYAIWDGGAVIVKAVQPIRGADPPRIRCSSLNPKFEPFDIVIDGDAHIIGRVVGRISRM